MRFQSAKSTGTERPGVILFMRLENIVEQKKALVLKKWFEVVVQTYPADASNFLKTQKDPFSNPVGKTFSRGLEALFDLLLKGWDAEAVSSFLDPMIRIRAVQDFTPAQAVAFVFSLKHVIRECLSKEVKEGQFLNELPQLESKIDEMGLMAFDIYMKCREKIFQLKSNELKNSTFSAFKRAGLISEIPAEESENI
jgi:hypothetical protein